MQERKSKNKNELVAGGKSAFMNSRPSETVL